MITISRPLALFAGALLLAGTTGACTDEAEPGPTAPSASDRQTQPGSSLEAREADVDAALGRLVGRLSKKDRARVTQSLTAPVVSWIDAAFLREDYPTTEFPGAFAAFSAGAREQAGRDSRITTNRLLGKTAEEVVPRRQRVRFDVLSPRGRAVAATARVSLVFLVVGPDEATDEVSIEGRLRLARDKRGDWQIFAYDLARSQRPGGES